ncbi:hypothetical protein [Leptospira meyeri]|uniref:hypothetical protein n=1 Tax=Leptospira meyeri TaxID=29508 RepID=UPI001438443C|nr:hypothetical protein [Leptospira meyeri]
MKLSKIQVMSFFFTILYLGLILKNCTTDRDKEQKRCQNANNILQLCLIINQNDSRYCDTQAASALTTCQAAK